MSEDMEYLPSEDDGVKKRFEMTIPILLLILVIIVVGAKLQWFNIPIISDLFGKPATDIAVIGYDADTIKALDDIRTGGLPINTYVFNKSDLYSIRDSAYFAKYGMIILTEGKDGDTIDLEHITLDYLSSFVASGKPAIVIGLAGSRVTNSTDANGWTILGFVPAKCKAVRCESVQASYDRITLYVKDVDHTMLREFGPQLSFQNGQISYAMVNPDQGSSILDMEIATGANIYDGAAITERSGSVGGRAVYFAFPPSLYKPLLYNAINYLR
jgi:hypothetical protein